MCQESTYVLLLELYLLSEPSRGVDGIISDYWMLIGFAFITLSLSTVLLYLIQVIAMREQYVYVVFVYLDRQCQQCLHQGNLHYFVGFMKRDE